MALGRSGATTVASTSALAHRAGIAVFATGGLGGVHRGAADSFDVSADLGVLAGTPVLVVCAGVKSILDVPATLEYLETLSVPVIGYRTDAFPGFYLSDSGEPVTWRVETAAQAAAIVLARRESGHRPRPAWCWPTRCRRIGSSTRRCTTRPWRPGWPCWRPKGSPARTSRRGCWSSSTTRTHGESLRVNVDLVLANAALAGEVAVAAGRAPTPAIGTVTRPHVTVVGDVGLDVVGQARRRRWSSVTTPGPG